MSNEESCQWQKFLLLKPYCHKVHPHFVVVFKEMIVRWQNRPRRNRFRVNHGMFKWVSRNNIDILIKPKTCIFYFCASIAFTLKSRKVHTDKVRENSPSFYFRQKKEANLQPSMFYAEEREHQDSQIIFIVFQCTSSSLPVLVLTLTQVRALNLDQGKM